MAVATGTQIRPELSAVDYTPFLQAASQSAQMQAQGIAALGQGVAKGFESYVQNKEKEKQAQGVIKAADVLSSGFEPILEKVDPRIATALQDLRTRISDPNLSMTERAYAARSFMEGAPTLLNAGVKVLDTEMAISARKAEVDAKRADLLRKNNIASAARSMARGMPVEQSLTEDERNEAFIQAAALREKGQITERVDVIRDGNVVPVQRTTNLLTNEVKESQIREPFPTVEQQAQAESRKQLIGLGAKTVEKVSSDLESANLQADLADQMLYALESGATTGPFAEASATVKSLAESIFGGDYGATVQKLYVQGAKGLSMIQIRNLMRGLGAMSDDDRKAAEKAFLSAKDPAQAIRYYAELAKLNKERADARQQFIVDLRKNNTTLDVIDNELLKLKASEPMLSDVARKNVGLIGAQEKPQVTPAPQSIVPISDIQAEMKRRNLKK